MAYFTSDYLEFFKELAANNRKEWFDANRKRYETVVRDPFKKFIAQLIAELSKTDPEIDIDAKDAIFRINRDIRFSKDKTPYKLNNSALISPEGRRNKNSPGVYVEFGPEKLGFYGGIYAPSPSETQKVRKYMHDHPDELHAALTNAGFRKSFGQIHGEKSKRIPKEFIEAAKEQPLLWNKQWYYYAHLSPELILGDDLMQILLDLSAKALPMKEYLSRAIHT